MSDLKTERSVQEADDAELIRRAQAGEAAAYEELVRRWYPVVYGFAYHMVSSREEAELVAEQTFVRVWKHIGDFRFKIPFRVWVCRIVLHAMTAWQRHRDRRGSVLFDGFDPEVKHSAVYRSFSSKGAALRKISLTGFQEKIGEAMLQLTDNQRAVVTMTGLLGMPSGEAADVLRSLDETVRVWQDEAVRRLQADLSLFLSVQPESGAPAPDLNALLELKKYERPDEARTLRNMQNIMRIVRSTSNVPSLLVLPEKGLGVLFSNPRYGVIALFILFLVLHLLKRPVPVGTSGVTTLQVPTPAEAAGSADASRFEPTILPVLPRPAYEPLTDGPGTGSLR